MKKRSNSALTMKDKAALENRLRSSASWFYWIAVLAAIQGTAIAFQLGDVSFIGLGVTLVIDPAVRTFLTGLGAQSPLSLSLLSLTCTLVFCGFFVLCGFLGGRRHLWAFMTGICLYTLDALVCILIKDYISLIFHAGALVALLPGPGIIKQLHQMNQAELLV